MRWLWISVENIYSIWYTIVVWQTNDLITLYRKAPFSKRHIWRPHANLNHAPYHYDVATRWWRHKSQNRSPPIKTAIRPPSPPATPPTQPSFSLSNATFPEIKNISAKKIDLEIDFFWTARGTLISAYMYIFSHSTHSSISSSLTSNTKKKREEKIFPRENWNVWETIMESVVDIAIKQEIGFSFF